MIDVQTVYDQPTDEAALEVELTGSLLLESPIFNKGSAFSERERAELGLLGLLPAHVATIDEQLMRTYENFRQKTSAQERYIFLTSLQDRNETLFTDCCRSTSPRCCRLSIPRSSASHRRTTATSIAGRAGCISPTSGRGHRRIRHFRCL
jgi:hypothetical protein